MNKQFEYKGHKFNINVEFDTRIIDGERFHTITTNCMDNDNYYVKEECSDKFLTLYVVACEENAKKYIDKKLNTNQSLDERLTKLGFK